MDRSNALKQTFLLFKPLDLRASSDQCVYIRSLLVSCRTNNSAKPLNSLSASCGTGSNYSQLRFRHVEALIDLFDKAYEYIRQYY
jgi:hypothetical protein